MDHGRDALANHLEDLGLVRVERCMRDDLQLVDPSFTVGGSLYVGDDRLVAGGEWALLLAARVKPAGFYEIADFLPCWSGEGIDAALACVTPILRGG
jgi:hypothetical protein